MAFTWHPGQPAERASQVAVTFAAVPGPTAAGQTLVRLEHTGWDAFADPAAARAEYDHGWPLVLDRYREHVCAGGEDHVGDTWVALLHRPGPAAPGTGSCSRTRGSGACRVPEPDARRRLPGPGGPARRRRRRGHDHLRLPGRDQLGTATRFATEDDASVAGGFLAVTIRPWQVMMTDRGA